MKNLKFSVCEQTGRTFDIPMDEVRLLIKENSGEDITNWNEDAIANYLYNEIPDMLAKYEKENCYFESHVQDITTYEVKGV